MFEKYTEAARKAVFFARYEASQSGSPYIEVDHLLLGILHEEGHLLVRALRSPAKVEALREQIRRGFPAREKTSTSVDLPVSVGCKRVFAYASEEAMRINQNEIGCGHLLVGIWREQTSTAARLLRENGVTTAQLRDELVHEREPSEGAAPAAGRDLVGAAGRGELGPLVGRERDLERMIQILSRRTKNNPVLIGEAGVGKSAIIGGLACRIAVGDAPPTVADRRVIAVDASSLTGARDWEEALHIPGAILFVRGLFNLAAAGSAWAVVEAMHALEPYLASGEVQCIATGSPAGLKETLDKAASLARHFEVVNVAPVSEPDAVRIVAGLKTQFETFHGVTFAEGAVETAVAISGRFLPGRHLPDRAIDLIDEAAAAVRLKREGQPQETSSTVTAEDIEAAVATRAGVPVAAVKRVLEEKEPGELDRITGLLVAQVPVEAREWTPFLAAYLARCSPAEAAALAQAIAAARPPLAKPAS